MPVPGYAKTGEVQRAASPESVHESARGEVAGAGGAEAAEGDAGGGWGWDFGAAAGGVDQGGGEAQWGGTFAVDSP